MTLARTTALSICFLSSTALADLAAPSSTIITPDSEYLAMLQAPEGGVYAIGQIRTDDSGHRDVLVNRISPDMENAWSLVMGGSQDENDDLLDVAAGADGDLFVLAKLRDFDEEGHHKTHVNTYRINPEGEVVWTHTSDSLGLTGYWPSTEKTRLATSTAGRTCIMENVVYESIQVRSLDADGNLEWDKNYMIDGVTNTIIGLEVTMNDSGETLVGGLIAGGDSAGQFAMSIAPDGTHQWTHLFPCESNAGGPHCVIKVDSDGNWIIAGELSEIDNSLSLYAATMTPSGTVSWQSQYSEFDKQLFLHGMDVGPDNAVVLGSTSQWHNGDIWKRTQVVLKFDAAGQLEWSRKNFTPNMFENNAVTGIACGTNDLIHVSGYYYGDEGSLAQICSTMNSSGEVTKATAWNPSQSSDLTSDVVIDENGDTFLCGRTNPQGSSHEFDGTVIKVTNCVADIDANGSVNIIDLLTLLSVYGSYDLGADLDQDGSVGVTDLLILLEQWNICNA
ncbi:MAG: hypothetical protein P8M22_06310 [Phycisphaerales bacterium]|nr:hypothetical protein [Phycisphaerales bacterium]